MATDSGPRVIYVWGPWVWYYRSLALITYAVGLLFPGLYGTLRDYVRHPSPANILLFVLVLLMIGAWGLWAYVTWRTGNERAVRIRVDPERNRLIVHTLNFGVRRIPLNALADSDYTRTRTYHTPDVGSSTVYEPTLTVRVRDGSPVIIDIQGKLIDREAFQTLFGFDPAPPPAQPIRSRKRRRRERAGGWRHRNPK